MNEKETKKETSNKGESKTIPTNTEKETSNKGDNFVGESKTIPTNTEKEKTEAEKIVDKVKSATTKSEQSKLISAYVNLQLANGQNPSAKYLKQQIISKGLAPRIADWNAGIGLTYDFVSGDVGKGIEYILTNVGVVCSMDESNFVPEEVWKQEDHTYIDTLDIPTPGLSAKTWRADRSQQMWKYVHYFLSGKEAELINTLITQADISFALMMFKKSYETLLDAYEFISLKDSSTEANPTNYLEGEATTMMDSIAEMRDFVMRTLDDNTQFNYGYVVHDEEEETDTLVAFEDAPNHISSLDNLKFIVNQETYNAIMKYLPYAFNRDDFVNYALKPTSWIIVPKTYQDVDLTSTTTINGQPSLKQTQMFYKDGARVKGTVMFLAGNNETLKWGNNFEQHETEYYPENATTQIFNRRNLNCKILKWSQLGVYQNVHLEDSYAVPVNQVSQTTKIK